MINFISNIWHSILFAVFSAADFLFEVIKLILYAGTVVIIFYFLFYKKNAKARISKKSKSSFPLQKDRHGLKSVSNNKKDNTFKDNHDITGNGIKVDISKQKGKFGAHPAHIDFLKNKESVCQLRWVNIPFNPNQNIGDYFFPYDCEFSNEMQCDIKLFHPKEKSHYYCLSDMLFFDIETTGLSGSGVYVFLCSMGYFKSNNFVIEQYFMEDLSDESFMLEKAVNKMKTFPIWVSFNGKSFDINRLSDRLAIHRIRVNLDMPHIDLLYPSRRQWKKHLSDCKLSTIEKDILKIYRKNDVLGKDIPEIYFDYINGNKVNLIYQIFNHNAQDVLTLPILLIVINTILNKKKLKTF